jgi:hypothetical protein
MDHAVWMLERMKADQYVDAAPRENLSDKIERMHKSWDQYPFLEKNLPKEEPKEAEPSSDPSIPATPPPTAEILTVEIKQVKNETKDKKEK